MAIEKYNSYRELPRELKDVFLKNYRINISDFRKNCSKKNIVAYREKVLNHINYLTILTSPELFSLFLEDAYVSEVFNYSATDNKFFKDALKDNIKKIQNRISNSTLSKVDVIKNELEYLSNQIEKYKTLTPIQEREYSLEKMQLVDYVRYIGYKICIDGHSHSYDAIRILLITRYTYITEYFSREIFSGLLTNKGEFNTYFIFIIHGFTLAHYEKYLKDQIKLADNYEEPLISKNEPPIELSLGKTSHRIVLLKELGVIDFLKDKYSNLLDGDFASLVNLVINENNSETVRKNLTYLNVKGSKNPINGNSIKNVKTELGKIGIELTTLKEV